MGWVIQFYKSHFLDSLAIACPSYISITPIAKSLPFVHKTNAPTLGSMTFNIRKNVKTFFKV
jgi:hypothetical protein